MKQVMNYNKDNGLLNMIRRTDPMIIYDTQGNLLGCTSEGYTGQIYVYKGYETLDL